MPIQENSYLPSEPAFRAARFSRVIESKFGMVFGWPLLIGIFILQAPISGLIQSRLLNSPTLASELEELNEEEAGDLPSVYRRANRKLVVRSMRKGLEDVVCPADTRQPHCYCGHRLANGLLAPLRC